MHKIIYLSSLIFIEIASSQIISNGMQNHAANTKAMAYGKSLAQNGQPLARSMAPGNGMPNGRSIGNPNIGNMVNNEIISGNLVNTELIGTNLANTKANTFTSANMITGLNPNVANANLANGYPGANTVNGMTVNMANPNVANANLANTVNSLNTNVKNLNYANANMANTNLPNAYSSANVMNGNNPNMATFNFGNNGNPFTVTSGSPGSRDFGIQVLADALEIGGTVAVNGRMPVYGAVALNGRLPTDGAASVSYSCGGPLS